MAALKGLWAVLKSPWFRRALVERVLLPLIIRQTGKITDKELRDLRRVTAKDWEASKQRIADEMWRDDK